MQAADPNEWVPIFDTTASLELGVTYTDFNKTMIDMADKVIELGIATKPATN